MLLHSLFALDSGFFYRNSPGCHNQRAAAVHVNRKEGSCSLLHDPEIELSKPWNTVPKDTICPNYFFYHTRLDSEEI